ncbi:MAG: orotidine 5'-phosphate decarboxylase [Deltaproteobacteria bacterium]|nr:orotidine 5'-phosphate decarboxylase [Deltaproteobacteria bacterium]MBW2307662.1 orotidine 5'-phosphate decarboxylase [Deltaproteobacteria bacterium]
MIDYALVLANDLTDPDAMLRVCRLAAPHIDGVKIGITSSMVPGAAIFRRVRELMEDKPILADFKVGDISFPAQDGTFGGTNARIIETLMHWGADYVTVHAFPGWSSMQEALWAAHRAGGKALVLPFMTHPGADLFFGMPLNKRHTIDSLERTGIPKAAEVVSDCSTVSELILALGERMGVDGFIGPGNQPEILQAYRSRTSKEIWSPGFGRQDRRGRDLSEQFRHWARSVGPRSAAIVGSIIYNDPSPAEAAHGIRRILQQATDSAAISER